MFFRCAAHIIIPWFLSPLHFLTSLCKLYCLFGRQYFQINPHIWIVPNDLNDNKPISVQIKACRLLDTKPLCEAKLAYVTGQYITGGRQLPTAAITISQHGGRRSRYKIIFAVYAIIKHPFLVLGVCIHRNSMYTFIEHCYLSYLSWLLQLDGGEGNGGLMVIYNSQKHRMMVIAPMVWW